MDRQEALQRVQEVLDAIAENGNVTISIKIIEGVMTSFEYTIVKEDNL